MAETFGLKPSQLAHLEKHLDAFEEHTGTRNVAEYFTDYGDRPNLYEYICFDLGLEPVEGRWKPVVQRFTLGVQYEHEDHPAFGPTGANGYVEVSGATAVQARALMVALAGLDWAFQYDPAEWAETKMFKHGMAPFLTIKVEDKR